MQLQLPLLMWTASQHQQAPELEPVQGSAPESCQGRQLAGGVMGDRASWLWHSKACGVPVRPESSSDPVQGSAPASCQGDQPADGVMGNRSS